MLYRALWNTRKPTQGQRTSNVTYDLSQPDSEALSFIHLAILSRCAHEAQDTDTIWIEISKEVKKRVDSLLGIYTDMNPYPDSFIVTLIRLPTRDTAKP